MTGADRYFSEQMKDPKYRREYFAAQRRIRRNYKRMVIAVVAATAILIWAILITPMPAASAQPAPPDHGTGTDAECAAYGCTYGHDRCHQTRDGRHCETVYGIAWERLPDGPDGRYYLFVNWPTHYEPSRRSLWDRVAKCESDYRWDYNGSSGYDGGLQFFPPTWRAYGGTGFAAYAFQAKPEEQIAVAERVLRWGHGQTPPQGRGAWPHCAKHM